MVCGHGWMTEAGRRRRLVARTAITLLALAAATGARASCTANVPGNHIFALTGDTCPFASGTYAPTAIRSPWLFSSRLSSGLFANARPQSAAGRRRRAAVTVNATAASASYERLRHRRRNNRAVRRRRRHNRGFELAGRLRLWRGVDDHPQLLSPTSPAVATIVTTGVDSAGVLASPAAASSSRAARPTRRQRHDRKRRLPGAERFLRLNFGDGDNDYDHGWPRHPQQSIRRG